MKELTKYSRVAGYLEKLYDKLNTDFFDGALTRPVITIQSTARAYGHYSLAPIWDVGGREVRHEINIAAGTLSRPIENVVSTLLHEMVHQYNNEILNVQDCSRGGTYHNKLFRSAAEDHGLVVTRSEKYGWSHTEPSDYLMAWLIENDVREIPMNRAEFLQTRIGGGPHIPNGGLPTTGTKRSASRRYSCPQCSSIVRATKVVNVICGDCLTHMIES